MLYSKAMGSQAPEDISENTFEPYLDSHLQKKTQGVVREQSFS